MTDSSNRSPGYAAAFGRAAVPELLFRSDLGIVLGLTLCEAEAYVESEGIPHVYIAGRVAVRRSALFAWLASRESGSRLTRGAAVCTPPMSLADGGGR